MYTIFSNEVKKERQTAAETVEKGLFVRCYHSWSKQVCVERVVQLNATKFSDVDSSNSRSEYCDNNKLLH